MCRKSVCTTVAGFVGVLFLLAGCGGPKDDLNKAKSVVETALESWKNAEKSKDLVARGIDILDEDWNAGHRLVDFNVKSVSSQPQQGPRVVVMLNLQSKAKKKKDTEIAYEVILTDSALAKIRRDPFHIPQ
jgi:hypothetical protein